jgi:hypothetical protein
MEYITTLIIARHGEKSGVYSGLTEIGKAQAMQLGAHLALTMKCGEYFTGRFSTAFRTKETSEIAIAEMGMTNYHTAFREPDGRLSVHFQAESVIFTRIMGFRSEQVENLALLATNPAEFAKLKEKISTQQMNYWLSLEEDDFLGETDKNGLTKFPSPQQCASLIAHKVLINLRRSTQQDIYSFNVSHEFNILGFLSSLFDIHTVDEIGGPVLETEYITFRLHRNSNNDNHSCEFRGVKYTITTQLLAEMCLPHKQYIRKTYYGL